jgi:hypothetical protein
VGIAILEALHWYVDLRNKLISISLSLSLSLSGSLFSLWKKKKKKKKKRRAGDKKMG